MTTKNSDQPIITEGSEVVMHFTLSLEDGTVVETTRDVNEPISFAMGDGVLTAGLEAAILGLKAGDTQMLEIEPGIAFGVPDPANVYELPRDSFDESFDDSLGGKGTTLVPGLVISFETPNGETIMGTLLEVGAEQVKVDFNHPLAARTLLFEVEILSVSSVKRH